MPHGTIDEEFDFFASPISWIIPIELSIASCIAGWFLNADGFRLGLQLTRSSIIRVRQNQHTIASRIVSLCLS